MALREEALQKIVLIKVLRLTEAAERALQLQPRPAKAKSRNSSLRNCFQKKDVVAVDKFLLEMELGEGPFKERKYLAATSRLFVRPFVGLRGWPDGLFLPFALKKRSNGKNKWEKR